MMRSVIHALAFLTAAVLAWNAGALLGGSDPVPRDAEQQGPSVAPGTTVVLPAFDLPYLRILDEPPGSRKRFPDAGDTRPHVFVLFTLADCYKGYADVEFWAELEETFGKTAVVLGIVAGRNPRRVEYFLRRQGLRIPVLYDETGWLVSNVAASAGLLTPVVVLSTWDGRVVRVEPTAAGDPTRQGEVRRSLTSALAAMHGASCEGRGAQSMSCESPVGGE